MKKFVAFVVLVGLATSFGPRFAEERAAEMIETSATLAEQGEYQEAIAELDAARKWFGWTDARHEIADARREVVALAARRGIRLGPVTREQFEASRRRAQEGIPSQAEMLDEMAEQQGMAPRPRSNREALDQMRDMDRRPPPVTSGPVTSGQINPAMRDEEGNLRPPNR